MIISEDKKSKLFINDDYCYDKHIYQDQYCNKCGGKEFYIAQLKDGYCTVAMCIKCKIQETIHAG